jgi:hypothetical protein
LTRKSTKSTRKKTKDSTYSGNSEHNFSESETTNTHRPLPNKEHFEEKVMPKYVQEKIRNHIIEEHQKQTEDLGLKLRNLRDKLDNIDSIKVKKKDEEDKKEHHDDSDIGSP